VNHEGFDVCFHPPSNSIARVRRTPIGAPPWFSWFDYDPPVASGPTLSGLAPSNACDSNFGTAVAVGDFNGDRYDDLAIGAPGDVVSRRVDAGSVQVLYGGQGGTSGPGLYL
jgi:hypothetical protein